jgi:GntR family phosphonate transport system transcriptional regulator
MADRSTAAPLYEVARQGIRELIADGTYGPGDRLPSEIALAARFGIHRLTARRAIEELSREGVVVARKGSGTFVATEREPLPISIPLTREAYAPSLERQLKAAGRHHREPLLEVVRFARSDDIPEALVETGALCLTRSTLDVDGDIWVYSTSWFTQSRVTNVRRRWRESDGLYGVILDQVGVLMPMWRSIQAEPATPEVAEALAIKAGSPVLIREGLTSDVEGVALLYARRHARADRVRYVVDYQAEG